MNICFSWDDPITNEPQEITAPLPVAIGRVLNSLPTTHKNQPVHPLEFSHTEISRQHLIIYQQNDRVFIEDLNTTNGTNLNGKKFKNTRKALNSGDTLKLAAYSITIAFVERSQAQLGTQLAASRTSFVSSFVDFPLNSPVPPNPLPPVSPFSNLPRSTSTIAFNLESEEPEAQPIAQSYRNGFPFEMQGWNQDIVSVKELRATGLDIEEIPYATLGGGMGSFVYADTLRIYGVSAKKIRAIGLKKKPYERYRNLLENCQIKTIYKKRIRSGSDSCPDNIWGFPGYAIREAWSAFHNGEAGRSLYHLWQVFAEPIGADTYTPLAEDVFRSMDVEMNRIQWSKIIRTGVIKSIRKTDDGRYAIAYTSTEDGIQSSIKNSVKNKFLLAKYVHLCTGYPALKLVEDLQTYRDTYEDITTQHRQVVHGYEPHDYLYETIERSKTDKTVVIRGFGIVASQILDRLCLARQISIAKQKETQKKTEIKIVHLGRSQKEGNEYKQAKRFVEHNWEFQPYNWPKACWGGDMRSRLEAASPLERRELLEAWGGTTTASRSSWRKQIKEGLRDQWYEQRLGHILSLTRDDAGKLVINFQEGDTLVKIEADYIIDCTGLISDTQANPLLHDLIAQYQLPLNPWPQYRLQVENDFEVYNMQNPKDNLPGRLYASGIITLGGPYAGVDTFLGLQYAAHRIAESLVKLRTPEIQELNPIRSLVQWWKWVNRETI